MRPLPEPVAVEGDGHLPENAPDLASALPGQVTHERTPQVLYGSESLSQALRQLILYGRDGLPVLSADGARVEGWVTNASAMHAIARDFGAATTASTRAGLEADLAAAHQAPAAESLPNPLTGFRVIEVRID
jgi:CIC family chloride channel protein